MDSQSGKQKKYLVIAIGLMVMLITMILLVVFIPRIGKIGVQISFAPFTAMVEIDGEQVNNDSVFYTTQGTHKLVVKLNNFKTIDKEVVIDENHQMLFGILEADNSIGLQILNNHKEDVAKVEALASKQSIETNTQQLKQWPILEHLPYDTPIYKLGYTIKDNDLILTINTNSAFYINPALNKMNEFSGEDDILQYRIIINNLNNPFEGLECDLATDSPKQLINGCFGSIVQSNKATISDEVLDDDYYYFTIKVGDAREYSEVKYVVILKKEDDGKWAVVSEPYPFLTTKNTNNVPNSILKKANSLAS